MKYVNFEDVPVWKDGIELTAKIFLITEDKVFRFKGDVANQWQRSALSIPNNVAEGFERGTTPELIMFLYYAKGSAGEVRSICHVLDRLPEFGHLKSQIADVKSLATSVARQLSAWAQSLQETDIKGPRYLTKQSRQVYEQQKRAEAFLEQLKRQEEKRILDLRAERRGSAGPAK